MVRMVSHDLKNPLMGAMLHLDLIRDMATPNLTEPLNTVERQLERMNRIIRGVLDLEQIRNGLKVSEINNLSDITGRAIYDLKHLAYDKHIHLSLDAEEDHLFFKGDPDQMERALTNLIENAIKFTPEGGRVEVSLKQSTECVVVEVRDTGIGIPEEMHQKVFERFFRGRQKGIEHVSGSGLGLSIVKTIIENHHGTITLSSDYGGGTTFTVYLPQVVPDNSYSH
jgi:signal transduction histidine kinase